MRPVDGFWCERTTNLPAASDKRGQIAQDKRSQEDCGPDGCKRAVLVVVHYSGRDEITAKGCSPPESRSARRHEPIRLGVVGVRLTTALGPFCSRRMRS